MPFIDVGVIDQNIEAKIS